MEHTETLQMIAIDKLIPYVNNARTHSDEQIKQIQASIREFGFVNPVLIDENLNIIAGHGRTLAAKLEGIEEVPCVLVEYLTEAQKKAYMLADNKLALNAGWDMDILKIELEELKDLDFDLSLTGFDDLEIDLMFNENKEVEEDDFDVDKALEDIKEPTTKRGDMWQLGRHRLMCGDSTIIDDVDRLMDGNKANMVFTDPPYGYEYQSNMRTKTKKFEVLKNDDKILDFMPVLTPHVEGFVFICTTWKVLDKWLPLFKQHFELSNMVIWDKGGGGIGDLKKTFSTDYEVILVSHQGTELKGKRIGSVWNIPKDSAGSYEHATQKPIELSAMAIRETTQMNSIVLDVFGGSGSTLIAAEQTDRICYMMELDEKYCDVIVKRYEEYTRQKAGLIC